MADLSKKTFFRTGSRVAGNGAHARQSRDQRVFINRDRNAGAKRGQADRTVRRDSIGSRDESNVRDHANHDPDRLGRWCLDNASRLGRSYHRGNCSHSRHAASDFRSTDHRFKACLGRRLIKTRDTRRTLYAGGLRSRRPSHILRRHRESWASDYPSLVPPAPAR